VPSEQEIAAAAKTFEASLRGVLPWHSFGFALLARAVLEAAEQIRNAAAADGRKP